MLRAKTDLHGQEGVVTQCKDDACAAREVHIHCLATIATMRDHTPTPPPPLSIV